MMMPKVSMNKMAMNESVATTCCYKVTHNSTNEYWEILHGGFIGQGWVNDTGWLLGVAPNSGLMAFKDIVPVDDATGYAPVNPIKYDGVWYSELAYDAGEIDIDGSTTMDKWFTDNKDDWKAGSSCNHDNGDCAYRYDITTMAKNYHWDSTSAHLNDDWKKGHSAKQYSS